jgi:hypothetical protein
MNNLFHSLIIFIAALFFIMLGIVGIMIPWSSGMRMEIIQFILEYPLAILLFGVALVVAGLAIAFYILFHARRRYYYIYSGSHTAAVDEAVVQQYLNTYWKQLFPNRDIPNRLTIKNNKIHITVDLPFLPPHQQQLLLERIKQDLRGTFAKLLGYHNGFSLSASFQKEQ